MFSRRDFIKQGLIPVFAGSAVVMSRSVTPTWTASSVIAAEIRPSSFPNVDLVCRQCVVR